MNISKIRNILFAGAALLLSSTTVLQAATTADVLFVVDESGSMSGEHSWINGMVTALDTALISAGVTGNQFGLVGFGGSTSHGKPGHTHMVGGNDFGTAAQLATASNGLTTGGGTEDGYSGIEHALNNYTFRSNAAVNVILITDEDRDTLSGSSNTFASILSLLQGKNALLNAVVNARYTDSALGINDTDSFFADGSGSYTTAAGSSAVSGAGDTIDDYVTLALLSGGAAWDLNQLRKGGLFADSFTAAFVDIKVGEIIDQTPSAVPLPAAAFMFAPALLGFMGLRRKAKSSVA